LSQSEENNGVSEELENSLQQAIETYLGQRLHAIEEQLSQLQTDFGGALTRLRESAANESLSDTPLSASIFAHFQAARAQKLSGQSASSEQSSDLAALKRGVEQIEKQQSHGDVLSALLTCAVAFAERVALFVVKNDQTIGWKLCEAGDPANLESIRVALPLSAETLLSQAVRSRSSWSGTPETHPDNRGLIEQLGGSPKNVFAAPLVARGKVVAVLYADSTSSDPDAIGFDAMEVLARVAAMAVDLAATRPAQAPTVSEPVATQPSVATVPTVAETEAQMVHPEITPEVEPSYVPQVEPQTREVFYEPEIIERAPVEPPTFVAEPIAEETAAEPAPEVFVEPTVEPAWPEPVYEPVFENVAAPTIEPDTHEAYADTFETPAVAESVSEPVAPPSFESAPEVIATPEAPPAVIFEATPPPPPPAPTPSFSPSYSAPLGTSRRYGLTEPELPIEVGDDERRLHNDARRFARLLVSEIKLYNEAKVRDGRSQMDLYDRLREDIDRSRQMYDKRVAPPVAARHDYFHQELVNTLAEGDPNKLGANYPGALVTVS
jgi:hypothetical protein